MTTFLVPLGCSTPQLNKWVDERGYQFHKDYSSIDTLGWLVQESGVLAPNQMFKVVDRERGDLPDMTQKSNLTFKVEGKAETQKFLRKVADVALTNEFETIHSAEVHLVGPHKFEATRILPLAVCNNQEVTLVTKVLNTGEMIIKLYDEAKNNITGQLTITGVDVKGKSELHLKDTESKSGCNLFVGYFPQRFKCRSIASTDNLIITKGQAMTYGGIDFYYNRFRTVIDKSSGMTLPIADVFIAPSGFYVQQEKTSELTAAYMQLAQVIAAEALDERLKPLEEQLIALAPLAKKAQYLEAKVRDMENFSHIADRSFNQYTRWSWAGIATPTQIPSEKVSKPWGSVSEKYSDDWNALAGQEQKLKQKQSEGVDALLHRIKEQSQIADQKVTILVKLATDNPQVIVSAMTYQLAFGGRYSLPGQLPSSAVYIEVKEVTEKTVNIRIQHLALDPVFNKGHD
jgi:hypothetical protein